jgi:hypothetical protein
MDKQVPDFILDKDTGPVVQQVPTHEVKVLIGRGFLDRQSKISATPGRAVIAQTLRLGHVLTLGRLAVDGLCRGQNWVDDGRCHR